ncbi:MAG TPA: FKBP-type peptidyl-prolyl cis-trans isomerase [Thermoplasmata archaeon]|nr:FKBP-type peptidyl-prolyl cis-trans isomerase [Thermoplasmata archaeon]
MTKVFLKKRFRGKDLSPYITLVAAIIIIIIVAAYWHYTGSEDKEEKVYGVELVAVTDTHTIYRGRMTQFALIIKNNGNTRDTIYLEVKTPEGIGYFFEPTAIGDKGEELFDGGSATAKLDRGSSCVVALMVSSIENISAERMSVFVRATSAGNNIKTDSIWLHLDIKDAPEEQREVKAKDLVQVNYTGMRVSGKIFDTNVEEVAKNKELAKEDKVKEKSSFSPLKVYVGPKDPDDKDEYIQVIDGFWQGMLDERMMPGETRVVRIDPARGYGEEESSSNELAGKWLVFEITLLSIDGSIEE